MIPKDVTFDRFQTYDLVVATCGYERRSSYLCRLGVTGTKTMAITYPGSRSPVFDDNRQLYTAASWEITDLDRAVSELNVAISRGSAKSIAVDVSSMPRHGIASLVELFASLDCEPFEVNFLYCPGDFAGSAIAAKSDSPMSAGAVTPYFSGTLRPPSIPIGLIVGLGLEPYRAAGIMELLEPARTWLFTPNQGDDRFVEASSIVHHDLLTLANPGDVFDYSIRSLAKTYLALESLCFSTGLHYRLIMAPSGPKLFSLACLLVGSKRDAARPAVWRVGSSSSRAEPVSVEEAGDVSSSVVAFGTA